MAEKIDLGVDVSQLRSQLQAAAGTFSNEMLRAMGSSAISGVLRATQERMGAQNLLRTDPTNRVYQVGLLAAQEREERASRRLTRTFQEPGLLKVLSGIQVGGAVGQFGAGVGQGGMAGVLGSVGQFAALIGKVPAPLLIATAAIGALGAAALSAARQLTEIAQARFATGGTTAQVGTARALAAAVGMEPGAVTGLAHSFRERLSQGGLAAASFGVAMPRGVAPMNEMELLLRGIERVRRAPTNAQAQLLAERAPELEPFLQLRGASEQAMQRIRALAEQMNQMAGPENTAKAMEWNLQLKALGQRWDQLMMKVGTPVLQVFSEILGYFLQVMDQLGLGNKKTPQQEAQDAQVKALNENSRQLQMTREGMFGGGPWARGAVPSGLRGIALNEALNAHAVRLGAF